MCQHKGGGSPNISPVWSQFSLLPKPFGSRLPCPQEKGVLMIQSSKLHYLLNHNNLKKKKKKASSFKPGKRREQGIKKWPHPLPYLLEDVSQAFLEAVAEEKPHVKPYFSKTIRDLEVVEGSAARFDCKIEGESPAVLPCTGGVAGQWAPTVCSRQDGSSGTARL